MDSSQGKAVRCKAAVCWRAEELPAIEEIEVAPPQQSQVRLKMLCSSLCHTDLLFGKGFPVPLFPRVLGHEGVGEVESVGEGVTEFTEGDLVIPTYIGECGECENCRSENTNFCLKFPLSLSGLMEDGESRMSVNGQKLYHFFSCSTWTEYAVVNVNYLVKIDSRAKLPHASILSCGFSTGYGAARKVAAVEKGSSVAVFGLGAVGLGVTEAARFSGAGKVIGVDVVDGKREIGERYGMTDFISAGGGGKAAPERIRAITQGLGVDYSFECTGVPEVLNQAVDCTKPGKGVTVLIGSGGTSTRVDIDLLPFMSGKVLRGTLFGGLKPRSDLPSIVARCINKELDLDALITHEVKLGDIAHAFELAKDHQCGKIIIYFG